MDRRWDKSKPPLGPFALNRDCPQAQGLVGWYPMGNASGGKLIFDEAGKLHLSGSASSMSRGPDGRPLTGFNGSSTVFSTTDGAAATAMPLTLASWGTAASSSLVGTMLSLNAGLVAYGSANFYRLVVVGSASPKQVRANIGLVSSEVQATYNAAWVAGTEFHVVGVFTSTSSRDVYYNGVFGANDTTSISAPTVTQTAIGRHSISGAEQWWNGTLGEQAVWNVALPAHIIRRLYDPGTRYELWYPLRSRKWFVQGAGGDVSVALTGSAATASAGTLGVSSSVAASGEAATASAGTLAPSSTAAVTGEASTAAAGTLTPSAALALTGEQSASGAGTLAPSTTIGLTGEAVTAAAGTITYNASGDVSVALTGAAVTASAGTLATGLSVAIGGEACTSATGTLAPGATLACTGSEVTTAAGTLTLGIVVPLAGLAVTAAAGTVTYQQAGSTTVALTGEAVTVSAGTLTYVRGGGGLTEYPIGHGPGMTRRDTGPAARRAANTSTRIR